MLTVGDLQVGTTFTMGGSGLGWRVFYRTNSVHGSPIVQIESENGTMYTLTPESKRWRKPVTVTGRRPAANTQVSKPQQIAGEAYEVTLETAPDAAAQQVVLRMVLRSDSGEDLAALTMQAPKRGNGLQRAGWAFYEPADLAGKQPPGSSDGAEAAAAGAIAMLRQRADVTGDITRAQVMQAKQALTDLRRAGADQGELIEAAKRYIRLAQARAQQLGHKPPRLTVAGLLR